MRTARNCPVTTKWRHTASGRVRWDVVPRGDVREPGFSVSAVVAQEGEVAGGAEAESIELGGNGGKGVDKVEIVAEWGG